MKFTQLPPVKGACGKRHPTWLMIAACVALSLVLPFPGTGASSLAQAAPASGAVSAVGRGSGAQAQETPVPGAPIPPTSTPAGSAAIVSPAGATDPVATLMQRLTTAQKIGQLFLTSYGDRDIGADSDIGKLVRDQHVGGIIVSSTNHNFVNDPTTPAQIATLTDALQAVALESEGVPLFVAVDHEGDAYPYTRVTGGVTLLPNAMTVGATWNPSNARAVGEIAGRELAALGVNLLLGPDVDVLNNPHPTGSGDMGTRTFGGDPWWVAQMGRAYICGVHDGGQGRVATVAKHFPGHGGSDRLPDQEIATVDKSLTELKRIELPPFFAVAGAESAGDCAITDAMMTSHIRYRGLQGNIRQFTAPISFDAAGMDSILGLPEFSGWHDDGLIVSDALGVPAVAKYFDPSAKTFPHRQIAKEALMAGNDLLSIDQFARPQAASLQTANLVDTISYFQEEYAANPQFQQRVEEAVTRILRLKLKLYGGEFSRQAVEVTPEAATSIAGQGTEVVNRIAREAVTLLYPQGAVLPTPPRRDENLLIVSDSEQAKECRDAECPWYEPLPVTGVQDAILRLYGPDGTRQIDPERIHSISFIDLKAHMAQLLEGNQAITPTVPPSAAPTPEPTPRPDVSALLEGAKWIIFAMRNSDRDANADAVRVFLDNGDGRLRDTRLVVLAFNAPYYLDTTQISKLTLYLAAYSKTPPSIEAAVRALFGEFVPRGHSPVNVEGINYDLLAELAPDPARPIEISLLEPGGGEPLQVPTSVRLQAGPLIDGNGNRVPDGTEVTFEAAYEAGNQYPPAVKALTKDGLAEASFSLRQPGGVVFSARSGNSARGDGPHLLLVSPPTPTASPSASPSSTSAPSETATLMPSPTPTPAAVIPTPSPAGLGAVAPDGRGGASSPLGRRSVRLLLALLGTGLAGLLGFLLLGLRTGRPGLRLRWTLLCISGSMVAYILELLLLPAAWQIPATAGALALLGGLITLPLARSGKAERQA